MVPPNLSCQAMAPIQVLLADSWEQMADLLPILQFRSQKQGLRKRNVLAARHGLWNKSSTFGRTGLGQRVVFKFLEA